MSKERRVERDLSDQPSMGERPEIPPQAIAEHLRMKERIVRGLSRLPLNTKLRTIDSEAHLIDPTKVISVKPDETRSGHFVVRHKGKLLLVTGAALLAAAAGIRIGQRLKK